MKESTRGSGSQHGSKESLRAERNPACFVCGAQNHRGLRIEFRPDGANGVEANWQPSADWEGFRGIVHGGVVSTVLDEAMSKAVIASRTEALTAELRVRFRKPVESAQCLGVRGWVRHRAKRRIETEAVLTAADGSELAHAWAVFLALRGQDTPPDSPDSA